MLVVENISKQLPDGRWLLKDISFTAKTGEFIGVLGPSGAGKSLTMRSINGLMQPTSGNVYWEDPVGQKVPFSGVKGKALREVNQKVGMVFQGFHLVGRLTAIENVMMGRLGRISPWRSIIYGFKDEEAEEAMELLADLGIDDLAFRKVHTMSGGEMQRVAVARALFQQPLLMLADEPVANLDPKNAHAIMKMLKPMAEEIPVVGVFHQPEMVATYCTRAIAIREGSVCYDGDPKLSPAQLADLYGADWEDIADRSTTESEEN